MEQQFGVIVVAAGKGTRMGMQESKQYLLLQDKPVLIHTLERFEAMEQCASIALVTGRHDLERCRIWVEQYHLTKVLDIVPGGKERQHSVYEGLKAIQARGLNIVLIHDGVRPFVEAEQVLAVGEAAITYGAAVLAVPVKDTIKQVNANGVITATPDRSSLWAIQTPQAFRLEDVMRAHDEAGKAGRIGTDDAMLVEQIGIEVHIVEGSYSNIKLTTPEDLAWADWWLSRSNEPAQA
ncbi:2-C-methyl-D-erythritol 4-phosphate cytidylyltransferase [Paenibacillus sp. ACRRX]|uniref:2-C-methyl-D-erythritol 4-phosphate cytidylyltransferase n=1 Tax=unclassified Paenibacillus TaxID=185978 RepID=UPI001EF6EECD|nr:MULTISPECIES: 2-C-methyl-D-erythritol 4-phosphate cytidylyltransferase [unclassified Paenibacillus]MCG7410661.1 2-C-methyl-D-erythritol 4-phosphate cytidylyltransferase [Paenibacillus sp. ACRRX]MDK8184145.1 2-C-methyl-D-erythritol 4-phosphate cytidylyltransferase [Paenibacillus sp. UMB4589-SE434]